MPLPETQDPTMASAGTSAAAARAAGASPAQVARWHVVPAVAGQAGLAVVLMVPHAVWHESTLSFLGIGIQPPDVSWGLMVSQGRTYLQTAWWLSFFPGLAIVVTTVSATILAAWARIATDPGQRWRLTVPRARRRLFSSRKAVA